MPAHRPKTFIGVLGLLIVFVGAACNPEADSGPMSDDAGAEGASPCQKGSSTCEGGPDTFADGVSPVDSSLDRLMNIDAMSDGAGDIAADGTDADGGDGMTTVPPVITGPACGGCFANEVPNHGKCLGPAAACWEQVDHATLRLQSGACITDCFPGWADCDRDPFNGCEQDITIPTHCGSCAQACASGEKCAPTGCVATCPQGTTD